MLAVAQGKIISVSSYCKYMQNENISAILGIVDADYYPEKHAGRRVQRERIPVRSLFGNFHLISFI